MFNGTVVKSGFGVPRIVEIKCFLHLAILNSRDCHGRSLERQMLPHSVGWLQREAQTPVADGRGGSEDNHKQTGIIDCLRGVGQNKLYLELTVLLQNAFGRWNGGFFFLHPK